jgi:OFA family oxalate/formate antiporter-like MFS transporter
LLGSAIAANGFQATFFAFGLVQGLVVMVLACFLFAPQPGQVPQSPTRLVPQGRHQYEPLQVVRAPVFWVMYVMFVLMAAVRPDGDPLTGPY